MHALVEDRITVDQAEVRAFCGYNKVDYAVIWSTISNDPPSLVTSLEGVLVSLDNPGTS